MTEGSAEDCLVHLRGRRGFLEWRQDDSTGRQRSVLTHFNHQIFGNKFLLFLVAFRSEKLLNPNHVTHIIRETHNTGNCKDVIYGIFWGGVPDALWLTVVLC